MNRTSTKAVDRKTLYEAAFVKKPNLRDVRKWGEKVWVRIEGGDKLGGQVHEGRWMGIDEQSKGVQVYWPDKTTVGVKRNVYYDKTITSVSHLKGEEEGIIEPKTDLPNEKTPTPVPSKNPVPTPPRIPSPLPAPEPDVQTTKRIRKPSQHVLDIVEGRASSSNRPSDPTITRGIQLPPPLPPVVEQPKNEVLEWEGKSEWIMATDFAEEYAMLAEISETEAFEPRTLTEAKHLPDCPLWEKAIEEELETLQKAGTWELTEARPEANIIGSKWVFCAKKDAAGNVIHYKARLVAQGFSQVPGVDYFDTFTPVAKLASIRAILAIAAADDLEMHQIDIKGAYLNGELTKREVIYMQQPPRYHTTSNRGLVCCLRKTLYGLKQSGHHWYQKLVEIMMTHLKFSRDDVDQAVFFRREEKSVIVVLVHVNDCTITASSMALIKDFKARTSHHVEITDLGELHWLLGIEVKHDLKCRTIHLTQRSYLDSILRRYGFQDLRPVSIPMDTNIRLTTT